MVYNTVAWAPDDEMTSQKLQQMCDNDTWLKENALTVGRLEWHKGNEGQLPVGRVVGTYNATTCVGLFYPFDSVTPVQHYDLRVQYPPLFTKPPIIVAMVGNGSPDNLALCVTTTFDSSPDFSMLKIFHRTGNAMRIYGGMNIILFGV